MRDIPRSRLVWIAVPVLALIGLFWVLLRTDPAASASQGESTEAHKDDPEHLQEFSGVVLDENDTPVEHADISVASAARLMTAASGAQTHFRKLKSDADGRFRVMLDEKLYDGGLVHVMVGVGEQHWSVPKIVRLSKGVVIRILSPSNDDWFLRGHIRLSQALKKCSVSLWQFTKPAVIGLAASPPIVNKKDIELKLRLDMRPGHAITGPVWLIIDGPQSIPAARLKFDSIQDLRTALNPGLEVPLCSVELLLPEHPAVSAIELSLDGNFSEGDRPHLSSPSPWRALLHPGSYAIRGSFSAPRSFGYAMFTVDHSPRQTIRIPWRVTVPGPYEQEVAVIDHAGHPVGGLIVTAQLLADDAGPVPPDLLASVAATDEEGVVKFRQLPRGRYRFHAYPDSGRPERTQQTEADAPGPRVTMSLGGRCTVTFSPIRSTGASELSPMSVYLRPQSGQRWMHQRIDARAVGKIATGVRGLNPGWYDIQVKADSRIATRSIQIEDRAEVQVFEIDLRDESKVTGQVTSKDGAPIAGLWLTLEDGRVDKGSGVGWRRCETDAAGRFQLSAPGDRPLWVHAWQGKGPPAKVLPAKPKMSIVLD